MGDSPAAGIRTDDSGGARLQSCLNMGRPLSKPKYSQRPMANKYREEKVKEHPDESEEVPETGYLKR